MKLPSTGRILIMSDVSTEHRNIPLSPGSGLLVDFCLGLKLVVGVFALLLVQAQCVIRGRVCIWEHVKESGSILPVRFPPCCAFLSALPVFMLTVYPCCLCGSFSDASPSTFCLSVRSGLQRFQLAAGRCALLAAPQAVHGGSGKCKDSWVETQTPDGLGGQTSVSTSAVFSRTISVLQWHLIFCHSFHIWIKREITSHLITFHCSPSQSEGGKWKYRPSILLSILPCML